MLAFHTQPRWQMITSTNPKYANTAAVTSNKNPFSSKSNTKSKISKPLISLPIRIPTPRTPLTTRRPIRLLPPYDDEAEVGFEHPPMPTSFPPLSSAPPFHTNFGSPLASHPVPHSRSSSPTPLSERPLPNPPPPAYGRWRDSIRIPDPEHTDLQQLTRELAMAEAGWSRGHNRQHHQRQPHLWTRTRRHHHHRRNEHSQGSRSDTSGIGPGSETAPPSYSDGIVVTSDVYVDGEGMRPSAPRPVLAPAPLFASRGR